MQKPDEARSLLFNFVLFSTRAGASETPPERIPFQTCSWTEIHFPLAGVSTPLHISSREPGDERQSWCLKEVSSAESP